MNINEISQKQSKLMAQAYEYIRKNPETAYVEYKTDAYMKEEFKKLGYIVEPFDKITGFTATFDTGREGKTLGLFAELDSVVNPAHPECDKETGAVHACGHDFQCASLLGVASVLKNQKIDGLSGKIKFIVVPAEEGFNIDFKRELIKKGVIRYPSGKQELISRGVLDDVDIGYMNHISCREFGVYLRLGAIGLIRKSVTFLGKSAHAGANPSDGINALYSANLALSAINSLRETFREEDYIRVHPIITKGGDIVNAVPREVKLESYVRGANFEAIKKTNDKVNRAIAGAALSMGANAKVVDIPGSMPLLSSKPLLLATEKVAKELLGEERTHNTGVWSTGSTDMGDISEIMPAIMCSIGGATGSLHGEDYRLPNYADVCVQSCALQVGLIIELLKDDCKIANEIINTTPVAFKSKEEYLNFLDSFFMEKELVNYKSDTSFEINIK